MVMFGKMNFYEPVLTRRENDIMQILWDSDSNMTVSQMVEKMEGLTINTAQAVTKKLKKRGLIEVGEIVYSGTVLCRAFKPTINRKDFETKAVEAYVSALEDVDISRCEFAAALIEKEADINELNELEKMIKEMKTQGRKK